MTRIKSTLPLLFLAVTASALLAQNLPVTEIKLRTDPEEARLRPLESIPVQVLVYGQNDTEKVRIQRDGAKVTLPASNSGWLSKPFRFQGREPEPFFQQGASGLAAVILGQASQQYALQDAVLYTAPERSGKYEVKAELGGKSASITITVDSGATALKPAERQTFGAEPRPNHPYHQLAEHYAPFIAQETWFQPKSDYLARFDLDGDWDGGNNWENAESGSSQAYVHYEVMETETHWFLIYNFFHPRDYSDKCVGGTCHENDNEGLILTVLKDGSPHGRLQVMETLAHNNIYSLRADKNVRKALHDIDGDIELHQGSHPVVFIEAGGHGVYGSLSSHSRFTLSAGRFKEGTGVTYAYKGRAERARHPDDREVGYELLSIYQQWWTKAQDGRKEYSKMFGAYYVYTPYGNRQHPKYTDIAGSFLGRMHGSNKAKPFWGWHDNRTAKNKILSTGQWGLDPAYAVTQNLQFPTPFSLNYVFNPYLGIGEIPPLGAAPASLPGSVGGAISQLQPAMSKDFNPNSAKGQFDIRLHVDDVVEVEVQAGLLRLNAVGGRPPRDDGSEYSQPLPQADFRSFQLEQKDGRGKITLLEKPSPENNYTAKLRFEDSKGGEARYHARLTWESLTTPSAASPAAPAPARSRVLDKHLEGIVGGTASGPTPAAPAPVPSAGSSAPVPAKPVPSAPVPLKPVPAPYPSAPLPLSLPGIELTSADNNPSAYNNDQQGRFEFRGRVDGTVIFRIQGDRVFAENAEGRPAEVERFSFTQPLPSGQLADATIDKQDGRGKVELLDRPSPGNNFTASIRVSDPKGGDDRYHFRLEWKR